MVSVMQNSRRALIWWRLWCIREHAWAEHAHVVRQLSCHTFVDASPPGRSPVTWFRLMEVSTALAICDLAGQEEFAAPELKAACVEAGSLHRSSYAGKQLLVLLEDMVSRFWSDCPAGAAQQWSAVWVLSLNRMRVHCYPFCCSMKTHPSDSSNHGLPIPSFQNKTLQMTAVCAWTTA